MAMGRVLTVMLVLVLVLGLVYALVKLYSETFRWGAAPVRPKQPWERD